MRWNSFFSILIVVFTLTGCGFEIDPRTLWHNRQGVSALQEKRASDAQGEFFQALGIDPLISEIQINLGLTFFELKQSENALKSFETAEKWAANPQAHFISRFNQGVTRMTDKKVEEALLAFQRALDVKPDSLETKTNIELMLIQQAQQEGQGEGKGKDGKDQGENSQEGDSQDKKNKDYQKSEQYQMKEQKGELSSEDVKKILGELKQQEQKIRGQYYRNEMKEKPLEKDW
jgi:Ca-activated chloride channel family protein